MSGQYVQYGCGLCAPEGWLNFDASPTLRIQRVPGLSLVGRKFGPVFPPQVRYGDICRGLPVADKSCDGVYCSHVLEHLSLADCRAALKNTYRILRPGGIFRLVLPDLRVTAEEYLASDSAEASLTFMRSTWLGQEDRPRGMVGLLKSWLGNAQHRWMWDYRSLEQELAKAGFQDVRRAAFGDSKDPHFGAVEHPVRWEKALGIECRRPESA